MIATAKMQQKTELAWPDERLVRECLGGNQDAWSALIDKYKKLIYSIPVKWELPSEDANDIFQSVCVDLYSELPRLREPRALPKWLIQTTLHKCVRCRKQQSRYVGEEPTEEVELAKPRVDAIVLEAEQEQILREAIARVPERCSKLIRMLFFESPARAYGEIARQLGLATGSIGFTRARCLDKLRKQLKELGFGPTERR